MLLSTFQVTYPEFRALWTSPNTGAQVTQFLAMAALEMDQYIWGAPLDTGPGTPLSNYDSAHGLLTAHKLALTPFGQNARMVAKQGLGYDRTTYGTEYKLAQRRTASGYRVTA